MTLSAPAELPGARESNAGDEFHVLWVMDRCLTMLTPGSDLSRVVVEDVSPADKVGAAQRSFLAADVTQYFWGDSFADARRVEVSQLKYSHRNPNEPWTASRLAPPGVAPSDSILGKLADVFRQYRSTHSRAEVIDKLRLQLVSNQPIGSRLQDALTEVGSCLQTRPGVVRLGSLAAALSKSARGQIELLGKRSGLPSTDFVDLLRVLDLGQLGTDDRMGHSERVVRRLSDHVLGDPTGAARLLFDLVRKEALPEASGSPGLRPEHVLVKFGVTSWSDLHPCPSHIVTPEHLVDQPDALVLADLMLDGHRTVIAHGDAGVGKTTTLTQVVKHLPSGSHMVHFDCFAGGDYLNPSDRRHLPRQALTQIINEIAHALNTPLLIDRGGADVDIWKKFETTLKTASDALVATNGLLVVAIDAADNSVLAARERPGDSCLVPDIFRVSIPDRVRLLVTCRTGRLSLIQPPDTVHQAQLTGFDVSASATHLRYYFSSATDEECQRFHDRSAGNPRSQFYALTQSGPTSAGECVEIVRPTPANQFEDLIAAAFDTRHGSNDGNDWLATLVSVQRPISLGNVARILEADEEAVHSFGRGLVPGLNITSESVLFRDEDFEAHVRDRLSDEDIQSAHSRIADYYLAHHDEYRWAAEDVGRHLYLAGRPHDLIRLTTDHREPTSVDDRIARTKIFADRVSLALQAAADVEPSAACRLLTLAAHTRRTNDAVTRVVKENPELAMQYADPRSVAIAHGANDDEWWEGPLQLTMAALAARTGELDEAQRNLQLADAWLRDYFSNPAGDRDRRELTVDHIAAGAEAIYHLHGPGAAAQWIRLSWRPRFAWSVATALCRRLLGAGLGSALPKQIAFLALPAQLEAELLAVLYEGGVYGAKKRVRAVADDLVRQPPRFRRRSRFGDRPQHDWTAGFAELAAWSGLSKRRLVALIDAVRPPVPTYVPSYGTLSEWNAVVRLASLRCAAEGSSFGPDAYVPDWLAESQADADHQSARRRREDRERLEREVGEVSELLLLRADAVLRRADASVVAQRSEELLRTVAERKHRSERWPQQFHRWARECGSVLALVGANSDAATSIVAHAKNPDGTAPLDTWLEYARILIWSGRTHTAAEHLLESVISATELSTEPAQDKVERLLAATRVAARLRSDHAAQCFTLAISAAAEMDDEASRVVEVAIALSSGLSEISAEERERVAIATRDALETLKPFMYEPTRLPWERTLQTVTHLSPDIGAQVLLRWDDSRDLPLEHGALPFVKQLLADGEVRSLTALHLAQLAGTDRFDLDFALHILGALRAKGAAGREELAHALKWVVDQIELGAGRDSRLAASSPLVDWIDQVRLAASEPVARARRIAELRCALPAPSPEPDRPAASRTWGPTEEDREAANAAAEQLIANASTADLDVIDHHLEVLSETWSMREHLGQYIDALAASCRGVQRVRLLRHLVSLPSESNAWRRFGREIAKSIVRLASQWNRQRDVAEWSASELPGFLVDRFPDVLSHEFDRPFFDEHSSLGRSALLSVVLRGAGLHLGRLYSSQLISLAKSAAEDLSIDQRHEDVWWLLTEILGVEEPSATPVGNNCAVGAWREQLLWVLLGNHDKRVRWRAVRVLKAQAEHDATVIERLFEVFDDRSGFGYGPASREFFWMSAQVWALLLIRRIACDQPDLIRAHTDRLVAIVGDAEFPHALMRELARSTLEAIGTSFEGLEFANRPKACQVRRRHVFGRSGLPDRPRRFRIDSMDVIPYWYDPLGRVFDLSGGDIAERAVRWIVDVWHFDDEAVLAADLELRERRGHDDLYKRHGSNTRLEDLSSYLEWHAMLLVAGELVDDASHPIVVPEYDEVDDPWDQWLGRYLNPTDGLWIGELRSAVPLQPWLHAPDRDESNWRRCEDADFDREVIDGDQIVVSASVEVSHSRIYSDVTISSALVAPETATALLRSLQDVGNFRAYALPDADDYHSRQIMSDEFVLRGWLDDYLRESTGLDKHDEARRIDLSHARPGSRFETWATARAANPWLLRCSPCRLVKWSDERPDAGRHTRSSHSTGRRLSIPYKDLLSYLTYEQMDLVLEVSISRNFDDSSSYAPSREDDDRYDPGTARLFLFRRDGTVLDGMGRYLEVGQIDRGSAPT